MITLGVLLAIDQIGTLSFGRTWPVLLIKFGLFKLVERAGFRGRHETRRAYVAPLLLIAIGALFLARNLYPEVPLMDYLARYWPFLLIVWGVLRLAEVLFWGATDKPLPRAGVSGGEWVLVVFLCIFGASLHEFRGPHTWWPHSIHRRPGYVRRELRFSDRRAEAGFEDSARGDRKLSRQRAHHRGRRRHR